MNIIEREIAERQELINEAHERGHKIDELERENNHLRVLIETNDAKIEGLKKDFPDVTVLTEEIEELKTYLPKVEEVEAEDVIDDVDEELQEELPEDVETVEAEDSIEEEVDDTQVSLESEDTVGDEECVVEEKEEEISEVVETPSEGIPSDEVFKQPEHVSKPVETNIPGIPFLKN